MFLKIARSAIFVLVLGLIVYGSTLGKRTRSIDTLDRFTLDYVEDFPALAADSSGQIWLAVIERPKLARQIGVFRVSQESRERVQTLIPDGLTGIGRPAIVGLKRGCMVAFAAQIDGVYQVAYAIVDGSREVEIRLVSSGGTANIGPSLATVGDRICCVWESNARGWRSIEMAWINGDGSHTTPQMISRSNVNNSNPDVVATASGALFAAWDSMREGEIDLYGAWYRGGEWQQDQRLTRDPRIERHVDLAANNDEVWLTWQAQSYPDVRVNTLLEQRVLVGRLDGDKLMTVQTVDHGEFAIIRERNQQKLQRSKLSGFLVRPEIGFDRIGRLWLAARKAIDKDNGWQAQAWCYSGGKWNAANQLLDLLGRWRSVPIAFHEFGGVAAVQYDNQPAARGIDLGVAPDWKSEIALTPLEYSAREEVEPRITEPWKAQKTPFQLADRIKSSNARQERRHIYLDGKTLTLYWGDLHAHSDMSVCMRSLNPPAGDLYAMARDVEMLDFTAITDHGANIDNPLWAYTREQVGQYHDPGRYITFLGQEWTSNRLKKRKSQGYGHHNMIFGDPHFSRFFDAFDDNSSPEEIWSELENEDVEFIMIPHQLADWKGKGWGNPPKDWRFFHEHHMPLAEVWQGRGSYEYLGAPRQARGSAPFKGSYLQDAWHKGIVIGTIASPDHSGGRGKVGVWARELTRESLFKAFHARHTFGTSGAKIALFFRSGEHMMGDKVKRTTRRPIDFQITVQAGSRVKEVVIFRNNEIVFSATSRRKSLTIDWRDDKPLNKEKVWYYTRIQSEDGELAWSSPIWFVTG